MRFIEELRDTHKKEIWILGTGGSGDDFPLDFFDDKISIALRPNRVIFPNCTYNFCSWNTNWAGKLKAMPHLLPKQIFTFNPKHRKNFLGKNIEIPIFMRTLKYYSFGLKWGQEIPEKYIRETIEQIVQKTSLHYCGDGLAQGWAIEAALVLGAEKITLAGCDGAGTKYKDYAKRLEFFYGHPPENGFSKEQLALLERKHSVYRRGQKLFAKILESHGIELMKYFYKEGYRKII